jgi:hypothetical protein
LSNKKVKIKKIRITLLVFSGLIILSFALFSVAQENSSSKNIFQDSDGDNLSNEEELSYGTDPYNSDTDGDGYTDFIEINSGYDPLKHAPGDKIVNNSAVNQVAGTSTEKKGVENASDKNLTEELSEKTANLINQSQSENKEIGVDDLDEIINQTMGEEITFENLPEIDEDTIKILNKNYSNLSEEARDEKEKEDATQYLTAVGYIIVTNSPQSIGTEEDVSSFQNEILSYVSEFSNDTSTIPEYFNDLADKGESMLDQLKDIEVPESLLEYHVKGLQLANYAISLKDQHEDTSEDPVSTAIYLSKGYNLLALTQSLFQETKDKIEELGIDNLPINLN